MNRHDQKTHSLNRFDSLFNTLKTFWLPITNALGQNVSQRKCGKQIPAKLTCQGATVFNYQLFDILLTHTWDLHIVEYSFVPYVSNFNDSEKYRIRVKIFHLLDGSTVPLRNSHVIEKLGAFNET